MDVFLSKMASWFNAHQELFSGVGGAILLALLAWAIRFRHTVRAYWPIPWFPFRYLRSLRADRRLNRWRRGSAILHAIKSSAVYVNKERVPLLDLLRRSVASRGRVLVLGEPGCGKTATFEALTYDLANRCFREALLTNLLCGAVIVGLAYHVSAWAMALILAWPFVSRLVQRTPIPIYIEMRKLKGDTLEGQLIETLRNTDGGTWLIHRLHALGIGRAVALIFDGVNELSQRGHESFELSWNDLIAPASPFGRCAALLSSRELSAGSGVLRTATRVRVCDLDDAGVRECLAFYRSQTVERDFETLRLRGMLRDYGIGRNPYWLRMMVESNLYTANRGALFENFARTLLNREAKPGDPSLDHQMTCLSKLGKLMSDRGSVGADLADVEAAISPDDLGTSLALARAESAMLLRRTVRERRIDFTHHLVQEFFTAYSLRNDEPSTLGHLDDYAWWGTLIMLGGLIDEHVVDGTRQVGDRARFRRLVLSLSEREGGQACLLAFGLLWTVADLEADLQAQVTSALMRTVAAEALEPAAVVALMKVAEDAVLAGLTRFVESNADIAQKRYLLRILSRVKTAKIAAVALSVLDDNELRTEAAAVLSEVGDAAVRPMLKAASENLSLQPPIFGVIANLGAAAVPALVEELIDDNSGFHGVATTALATIGLTLPELVIDSLRRDMGKEARTRVRKVLIELGDAAIPALWGAFLKGEHLIQANVIDALKAHPQRLVSIAVEDWKLVRKCDQSVRGTVVELLGSTGDPRAIPLVQELQDDPNAVVRERATDALLKLNRSKSAEERRTPQEDRSGIAALSMRTVFELSLLLSVFVAIEPAPSRFQLMSWLQASTFATLTEFSLFVLSYDERYTGGLWRWLIALFMGLVCCLLLDAAWPRLGFSPQHLLLSTLAAIPLIALTRRFWARRRIQEYFKKRVLILGTGRSAETISKLRRASDHRGFAIVGYVRLGDEIPVIPPDRILPMETSLSAMCQKLCVNEVVIALDDRRRDFPILDLMDAQGVGVDVILLADFLERETGRIRLDVLNPTALLLSNTFRPLIGDRIRRGLDIVGAVVLLVLTLPTFLLVAAAIKIEEGWHAPVLYWQRRAGLDGRIFGLLKFRSMRIDAESAGKASWASKRDARITRVGRVIRRARIDELPQCINLLRGELSLVGPRPERPEFVSELASKLPYYTQRHRVRPGMTGWAQLCYPYGSSEQDALEKLQYDLYFIKNRTVIFYIAILLQSVEVVFFGTRR